MDTALLLSAPPASLHEEDRRRGQGLVFHGHSQLQAGSQDIGWRRCSFEVARPEVKASYDNMSSRGFSRTTCDKSLTLINKFTFLLLGYLKEQPKSS